MIRAIFATGAILAVLAGPAFAGSCPSLAAKAEEASSLLLRLGGRAIADDAGESDDVACAA